MRIRLLLINIFGWFMNQTNLIILICNNNCIEKRKNFKIIDYFVDLKIPYFE